MKTTRRNFFKVVGVGLGTLALGKIAPALAQFKPDQKHPPDVLCSKPSPGRRELLGDEWLCRDYLPRVTVQDYVPGQKMDFRDLSKDKQDCSKCQYEAGCTCSGERWRKRGEKGARTKYPELWSKKLQKQFYNDIVGKL